MEAKGLSTKTDVYAQHFSTKEYLEQFFSFKNEKEDSFVIFFLKNLYQAFILDGIKGDTLIGIGSGPTIFQFLSACESFCEIIVTESMDQSREELQCWLREEPGAFDWSPVVRYVCELEGDREMWPEKEEKLRRTITQVLKSDVTQPNPLAPLVLPPADCLLSSLFLQVDCKDLPTFCSALKNLNSLLKPGGHLVMLNMLEATYYTVGKYRFPCLFLERKFLEEAVLLAGFDVVWVKETPLNFPLSVSDVKEACILVAQKCLC